MSDELIDIVNENNEFLGFQKTKKAVHKEGYWHRTVHCWIYNSENEVLLQLRAKDKNIFPDKWDVSVGGHVSAGEEPYEGLLREMEEEIGLKAEKEDLMPYKIIKESIIENKIKNNEFIYVFFMKYEGSIDALKIEPKEIQEIKFVSADFIKKDYLKNPDKYTEGKDYWLDVMDKIKKHGK